jgi:hypothetical protein
MDDTHVMFVALELEAGLANEAAGRRKAHPGRNAQAGLSAEHNRLVRPLAARAKRVERLSYRSRGATERTIYTGITHIAMQDQAITESMGEIVDHSFEHLAPSDQMITRTRRRLLLAARALRDTVRCHPASTIRHCIKRFEAANASCGKPTGRPPTTTACALRCVRSRISQAAE